MRGRKLGEAMRRAARNRAWSLVLVVGLAIGLGGGGVAVPPRGAHAQDGTPAPFVAYAPDVDLTGLSGTIIADGSSTVWPITAEAAERFAATANVVTQVDFSGTGGGFRRFCAGETDLQNASRPVNDEEVAACEDAGVAYEVFPLGFDGITVAAHPTNTWATCLTVEELRAVWEPEQPENRWRDVDASWPDQQIELYGPGPDSGAFDYFTEVINGEAGRSRTDYVPSENDLDLVEGVASQPNALGYFGYAYYAADADRLKPVAIDAGNGCVAPTPETIADGSYAPLSRPLFLYVNGASLERPEAREFLRFMMSQIGDIVSTAGYVPAPPDIYAENRERLDAALTTDAAS